MKRRFLLLIPLLCVIAGLLCWGELTQKGFPSSISADSLGMLLEESDDGLTVLGVRSASPASKCGMQPGDRLLSLDRTSLTAVTQLDELLRAVSPPCRIGFVVQRGGEEKDLWIKLKRSKEEQP